MVHGFIVVLRGSQIKPSVLPESVTIQREVGFMNNKKEFRIKRSEDCLLTLRTQSGFQPKEFYGPEDISDINYKKDLGDPGEYPYTRGRFKGSFRNMLWTKHLNFGRGSTEDSRKETLELLEQGFTSPRLPPDPANIAGIDPDHPLVRDIIGFTGIPTWSLQSMECLLEGLELTSGTINFPGAESPWDDVLKYACYLLIAQKRRVNWGSLRLGMINDPLRPYGTGNAPPQPFDLAWRLCVDCIEFACKNTPKIYPSTPNGYVIRESGTDTIQEIAWVIAIRMAYITAVVERGVPFEKAARRIAISLSGEIDFFESICKIRAARKICAKLAKERFGCSDPKGMKIAIGYDCAGDSMIDQQPIFNIIRSTVETMAGVLGGASHIETRPYDEPRSLPHRDAYTIVLGTNSILAHEANIALVSDPLGGSYYVEWLTKKIEDEVMKQIKDIEDRGGIVKLVKNEWLNNQTREGQHMRQSEIDNKEVIKVGINVFQELVREEIPLRYYKYDNEHKVNKHILEQVMAEKMARDFNKLKKQLMNLHKATQGNENLIPYLMEAFKAEATFGEIMGVMREAMGYGYDPYDLISRPSFLK